MSSLKITEIMDSGLRIELCIKNATEFFAEDLDMYNDSNYWDGYFGTLPSEHIKYVTGKKVLDCQQWQLKLAETIYQKSATLVKGNAGVCFREFDPKKYLLIAEDWQRHGSYQAGKIIMRQNHNRQEFATVFIHELFHWQSYNFIRLYHNGELPVVKDHKSGFCFNKLFRYFNEGVTEYYAHICRLLISEEDTEIFGKNPYMISYVRQVDLVDSILNQKADSKEELLWLKNKLLLCYLKGDYSIFKYLSLSNKEIKEIANWQEE